MSSSQFKVLIYEKELSRIAGWVEEYPNLETGGDLFGFWTHTSAPVVQFVLGPAPDSKHNSTSFYQGRDYLIRAGEVLRKRHGLQHIGEWHSHHQLGLAVPSSGDEQTVFRALDRYEFPHFLLCIANLREQRNLLKQQYEVNVGGFLFTRHRSVYQTGAWVVLPGESPIRENVERDREDRRSVSSDSKLSKNWKVQETSLESEVFVTTEPAEVSRGVWYSTDKGKGLLKEIYDDFLKAYPESKMMRTSSEEIYFEFQLEKDYYRIEIPNDFPDSSPIIIKIGDDKGGYKINGWSKNMRVLEEVNIFLDDNNISRRT
jgi:hypothetical protein